MALRREDLGRVGGVGAAVYRFPTERVRAAARAQTARDRRTRMFVRRRRAGLAAVGIATVVLGLLAGGPEATAPASKAGAPASIVVRPGQSIWDVAERYAPDGIDPRAYVDAVIELNGLDGGVAAGTLVVLPK